MIKPKTIIYLGGPMTGYEDFNHLAFVQAAEFLRDELDLAVHNPAKSFGSRKDLDHKQYMRHCVHMLLESQASVFLPGWEESRGATAEAYISQALGLPIYLLEGGALTPITYKLPTVADGKGFDLRKMLEWVDEMSDSMEEPLLKADGFDDAIIGICTRFGSEPHLVYSKPKVIQSLMKDGMSEEEAEEHFDFNIIGAWVGDQTPGFVETP
jgi:hypothetical protein